MARIPIACSCGRRMTVRADRAGTRGRCPSCGSLIEVPREAPASAPAPSTSIGGGPAAAGSVGATCTVCQTAIEAGEPVESCPECDLPYHAECWAEYGGCATYGCSRAPQQEEKKPEEVRKECPFCGESIPAKALRCPSCRERFEDARPVEREEYIRGLVEEPRWKAFRHKTFGFLLLSVVPCLGPAALVVGLVWLHSSERDFEGVGGIYKVMVGAGASMGGVHTLLLFLFLVGLATS